MAELIYAITSYLCNHVPGLSSCGKLLDMGHPAIAPFELGMLQDLQDLPVSIGDLEL